MCVEGGMGEGVCMWRGPAGRTTATVRSPCLDLCPTSVLSSGPVRGELCGIGGGKGGGVVCGGGMGEGGGVWRGPAGRTTAMARTLYLDLHPTSVLSSGGQSGVSCVELGWGVGGWVQVRGQLRW